MVISGVCHGILLLGLRMFCNFVSGVILRIAMRALYTSDVNC